MASEKLNAAQPPRYERIGGNPELVRVFDDDHDPAKETALDNVERRHRAIIEAMEDDTGFGTPSVISRSADGVAMFEGFDSYADPDAMQRLVAEGARTSAAKARAAIDQASGTPTVSPEI